MRRRFIEDGDDGSEVEGGWLCSTMLVLDMLMKAYSLLLLFV